MTGAPPSPAAPRQAGREVELSLVIAADDPEGVLRQLQRLRHAGSYILRAGGSERIVDRYFDTRDRRLGKLGLALRLRSVDGSTLIGIKGPQRRASTRTEDRLEREWTYSPEAVDEIRRRLGLKPRRGRDFDVDGSDPDSRVEAVLGVRLIQRRETLRLVRNVLQSRVPSRLVLAELALDRVEFKVRARVVRHYEVEVEAKRTGRGTKAAREVAAELLSRYDELAEWPFGKLGTGKAIERLVAGGKLKGLRDDGALTAEAYTQIRRSISRALL